MATANELREALAGARTAMRQAIEGAADRWEKAPEGDEEWSPRAVAEHAIPAEIMFAGAVCAACGYGDKAPANPLSGGGFASAADAAAGLDAVSEATNAVLQHVQDDELSKSGEAMGGADVARLLRINIWHMQDHGAQINNPAL